MKRRWARVLGMATLMAVGAVYALASIDWCRWPPRGPPALVARAQGEGALEAGAAVVALEVPYPVTLAGYGPWRSEASRANRAPHARALVLRQGALTVALVALDVVFVTADELARVRAQSGEPSLVLAATHTHSSLGHFDERPLAELAGTGPFRVAARDAVVRAAVAAVAQAKSKLEPVSVARVATADAGLCAPRSGDACDARLERVRFTTEAAPVASLVLTAAHPTTVPMRSDVLDTDYPGALADDAESKGQGVTFVLQAAGGNAKVAAPATAAEHATKLSEAMEKLGAATPLEGPLGLARVTVPLPRPDASRLVPTFSRVPATNLACRGAQADAELTRISIGAWAVLAVPAEVPLGAATELERAAQATVLSLANGYLGYVEPRAVAEVKGGESKRQYYAPALHEALVDGAKATVAP